MILLTRSRLACCLLLALTATSLAQEAADKPDDRRERKRQVEEPPEQSLDFLPPPFGLIRGNIRDLESTGYFTVTDVELKTVSDGREVLAWTVQVDKTITCRHIEVLLKNFRDVRFYSTIETATIEVFSTLLEYPERIKLGTPAGRLLRQDDYFELTVTLPDKQRRRLRSLDVNKVVFGYSKF